MNETKQAQNEPPKLEKTTGGDINTNSLADLLEWFLNYDQRVALVRHPDDQAHGVEIYPFENAEARFAIGVFQAIAEYDSDEKLRQWITEVLQALGESKQMNEDIAASYKLKPDQSHVAQAEQIPSGNERRLYLTSGWLEALCTAEVRFLGWVYQELYGKPFEPNV
jgi:hypothetical protein